MNQVTIVMYHYVRPILDSSYPEIKGLELDGFKKQLDYLSSKYNFVTAAEVISAIKGEKNLPSNACWLTFDDGYKDHVLHVLPELLKRGIQGAFFPPVEPVVNRIMLDVNSIHFILASASDKNMLAQDFNRLCLDRGVSPESIEVNLNMYAKPSLFDTAEVMYIKNMLQYVLPKDLRREITSNLFGRYVGKEQKNFADELYLSSKDVKALINAGMYVGSHGYSHFWMNQEDFISQEKEIRLSVDFLATMGMDISKWIMCYPYGAYNQDTIDLLTKMGCVAGLTTEVARADLSVMHPLKLPRFDTNNFPQ